MLEHAAVGFVLGATEGQLVFAGVMIWGAGFLLGMAVRWRSGTKLYRAPFFALVGALSLAGSLLMLPVIAMLWAIEAGVFWILSLIITSGLVALGFLSAEISLARARDAFGSSGAAFLAIIPLVNLVLLFKSSEDKEFEPPREVPMLLSGGVGVTIGIVLWIVSSAVGRWTEREIDKLVATEPSIEQSIALTASMLDALGVEKALSAIAAEAEVPMEIDDMTTLIRLEAEGSILRRDAQSTPISCR